MITSKNKFGLITIIFIVIYGRCYAKNTFDYGNPVKDVSVPIENLIKELIDKYDIPGVIIALVRRGEYVWSGAYGYADLNSSREMTVETVCRAESISKSVTAWGVLNLAEQGLVDLDAPVQEYLGNCDFLDSGFLEHKITIRMLLSHNSGMSLGTIGNEFPPESLMPSLRESLSREVHFVSEPGSGFLYSNTGFNLLELIVEEVTGRDFAEYMKNEILSPLGMNHSSFTWSETLTGKIPVGYNLKGETVPPYVYPEKASGGLYTSVGDIALFMTAGMVKYSSIGENVLESESINDLYMHSTRVPGLYGFAFDSYGLGHFIETFSSGAKAVSHGGQGHGWMTHFHFVPETGDGIVILTNSQRSWPLIARVLVLWSELCGFDSIGMGIIILGQKIMWTIISMMTILGVYKVLYTSKGIINIELIFINTENRPGLPSLMDTGISLTLISIILWSVSQDYFLLFSIFPVASFWMEVSMLFLASVLFISSLFSKMS